MKDLRATDGMEDDEFDLPLEDPAEMPDPYAERELHEKETFRRGFLLERKLILAQVQHFPSDPNFFSAFFSPTSPPSGD